MAPMAFRLAAAARSDPFEGRIRLPPTGMRWAMCYARILWHGLIDGRMAPEQSAQIELSQANMCCSRRMVSDSELLLIRLSRSVVQGNR